MRLYEPLGTAQTLDQFLSDPIGRGCDRCTPRDSRRGRPSWSPCRPGWIRGCGWP